jgi:hypothetical protein
MDYNHTKITVREVKLKSGDKMRSEVTHSYSSLLAYNTV